MLGDLGQVGSVVFQQRRWYASGSVVGWEHAGMIVQCFGQLWGWFAVQNRAVVIQMFVGQ
ncbi:hypothetical protein Hanom_Chr00s124657g01813051 [Helianthus anomalus]